MKNMCLRIGWRLISISAVSVSLVVLGLSSYFYGLAAQREMIVSIIPLLFSGVLLGRVGVWVTFIFYFPIILLGAWVDQRTVVGMGYSQDILFDLTQPLLGSLILALIMDRMLMKVEGGRRLNNDLILLCERLESEIREREASQKQLIHSQRVDALGKLAGNVSHEFNNLLGIVIGYVRRAKDLIGENEGAFLFLSRIEGAVNRGQSLTSRLLTLVRDDGCMVECVDIHELIRGVLPMIRHIFSPNVVFEFNLQAGVAPVLISRDGFESVLLNFSKNSCDALGTHGRFGISSSFADREVSIRIEDDGKGMSASVMERIFEPFYTTKSRGQGSGIGLAIAYRVVTEAGGRIEVKSEPGMGAIFTIYLPLISGF